MILLLPSLSVLRHSIAGGAMLVRPDIAHEFLALIQRHPIAARNRRKNPREEHLQADDLDKLWFCPGRIGGQLRFAKKHIANPFAEADAAWSGGTFKLGKFLVGHLRACGDSAELAAIVLA